MKLITRKNLAATAAQRWETGYFINGEWCYGEDKKHIYHNLLLLGTAPSPEAVNNVIGNNSWTKVYCHNCAKNVEEVVEVGQEPDYESYTAHICKQCLILALLEIINPTFDREGFK